MLHRQFPVRSPLKPIALAVALGLMGPAAYAIGLGTPGNTPIIGQPLRLDIPVTVAPGETLPISECVRISPPGDAPDRQFFPRNARVVVEGGTRPRIRILSNDPVAEPLIEFRLTLGCGNSFSRDFLVLSDVPTAIPTQLTPIVSAESRQANVEPRASVIDPVPVKPSAPPPQASVVGNTLRLTRDSNLNTLARARYPSNQATRDEYRRLMAAANPELFVGVSRLGSVPLPAGTILNLPANLPPPETGTPEPASEPVAKPPATKPPAPTPATTQESVTSPKSPRNVPKDRLVIGGNSAGNLPGPKPLSPRELASAMDRLERMLEDQGRTEHEMITNLETLNSAFIEVKNYVQSLEAHMRQVENAQRALQTKVDNRPEPKSLGVLELLALILASGATGAGLIAMNHRLQLKRLAATPHDDDDDHNRVSDIPEVPTGPPDVAPPAIIATPAITPLKPLVAAKPEVPAKASVITPPLAPKPALEPQPKVAAAPASIAVPPAPTFVPAAEPGSPPIASVFELDTSGLDSAPPPNPALETPLEFVLPDLEMPPSAPMSAPASPPLPKPAQTAEQVTTLNISLGIDLAPSERKGDDAVELAEIMSSMGLGKEAARTLVEHILEDPKRDLAPWLKALAIYRKTGQREEFEWLADQLRLHLNVKPDEWEASDDDYRSLIEYRHLAKRLITLWPQPECNAYLESLLIDNREGVRQGFPQSVAEEIILLQRILRDLRADE